MCSMCVSVGERLSGKESNQNIMSFANNIVDSMIIFDQHVYERAHTERKQIIDLFNFLYRE